MSQSPSSPGSAVGTANPEVSMSAPIPSPSMEPPGSTSGSMVFSPYPGTQPYSAATPAFTPLASPMTNPSPGPMQSHGSSSTPAKPVTALSIDEELSLKLGQTMKVLDNCMYLVQNFQGDQNDAMTKAVQSYVQRLGELHAYIQKNMPTSHMIPRSIMTWLDQHPTENPEKWTYLQLQECAKEAAAVQGKIQALQLLRDELRAGLGLE
ncbi:hypothetical protein SPRG_19250 [Saprolegnia parasitica CBS 223.65]|uniref:Mediator of RNA polymerase II transcription subunit 10 n=1 Tax=Saprolegnia parasitica (strain CBS 223.65) TaxID=695850 RepID=A0A067D3P2_SAPPC|nr:hypothetical protein SPRG_19250 [Saprolegnia parasitica CBS 223.65]KDO33627.1 hypothetical protein SPRG_19250 [Saprolegnia parasitica CBS 223.65]|eukprot:XP_012195669.1 hypothetical protein SPRG_19250 [Saprolegnia parasitica CBS 223.65]